MGTIIGRAEIYCSRDCDKFVLGWVHLHKAGVVEGSEGRAAYREAAAEQLCDPASVDHASIACCMTSTVDQTSVGWEC